MDKAQIRQEGRLGRAHVRHRAAFSIASRASSPAASASGSRSRARSCASRSVFLLDEPLSNLDAKLRNSARDELKHFQRSLGTTTIYVTHDQAEAMGLGDRIAVLNQGKVRQIGTPQEIYDDPTDTFVATFIGSPPMNLVEDGATCLGFRPESFLPPESRPGTTTSPSRSALPVSSILAPTDWFMACWRGGNRKPM